MNTLATRKQSKAIRDQMQSIRCELPYSRDIARNQLKQFSDWKYYVRKFPLASVSLAAIAAYLVIPAKVKPPTTGVKAGDNNSPKEASFFGGMIGVASAMALRTGLSIAARHLPNKAFSRQQQADQTQTLIKHRG